ncbi:hypothetical protein MASR2M15_07900 [Anaerolineales bacterium]
MLHYSIEQDLTELKGMLIGLEDYIQGNQLYGNSGHGAFGSGNLPSLTIGSLLLRMRRLSEFQSEMTDKELNTFNNLRASYQEIHQRWKNLMEAKMEHEINSRLDTMQAYFKESIENPALGASAYPTEAQRRTITQELLRILDQTGIDKKPLLRKAQQMDSKLKQFVQVKGFIWDDRLKEVYPADEFWWLYIRPPYAEEDERDN